MRQLSELEARRLLSGAPIALITTAWRGKTNAMPCAYCMPLSLEPPYIGIAVHPERHTFDMISHSEEFAINLPSRRLLHYVQYLGTVSGRDMNKLEVLQLPVRRARFVDAPLIEGCLAHIECSVEAAHRIGDHTLFVARVIAVQAEEAAFDEHWLLQDDDAKPLHYLGGVYYSILGARLEAKLPRPLAAPEEEIAEAAAESEELWREEEERRRREGREEE